MPVYLAIANRINIEKLYFLIPKAYRDEAAQLIQEDRRENKLQVILEYLIGGVSYRTRKIMFLLQNKLISLSDKSLLIGANLFKFGNQTR